MSAPTASSVTGPDPTAGPGRSQRRLDLIEAAYRFVLDHGLTGWSLRPLAAAVGSSPRVLLYLFASKEGLVRELLARARVDELQLLDRLRRDGATDASGVAVAVWGWLVATEHQSMLELWVDTYARSLIDPEGPWADFAATTVNDWLGLFADLDVGGDEVDRTLLLAVLRGSLLDLLATGDVDRVTAAVTRYLTMHESTSSAIRTNRPRSRLGQM